MCGYCYDSAHTSPSADDLISQFQKAMVKASKFDRFMVKIFTSGSFLDEKEVPADARSKILSLLEEDSRVFKVVVESRPEFSYR
jgi:radical SAM enzyme (TIGR01210 family)